LLQLGFEISEPTVSRYLQRLKRHCDEDKAKRWFAFLSNHREVIAAFDFFEAECAEEKRLFAELRHTLESLVEMQRSHTEALALGDGHASRFEEDIGVALWAWERGHAALSVLGGKDAPVCGNRALVQAQADGEIG
jgi:hypothetical protein